jgi:hypothetical protein
MCGSVCEVNPTITVRDAWRMGITESLIFEVPRHNTPALRNSTDRVYLAVTALLALAGLYACWAMLPLIWDGGYQFTDTLIEGRPYTYYGRVHTWLLWWPVVWAARFTHDPRLLQAIYGAPFLLAPAVSMFVCWWIARRRASSLLLWPTFGIAIGALPGQVFVINDTILMHHLLWPLLLVAILPATRWQWLVAVVLAVFQFIQPMGVFHLVGVLVAAVVVGVQCPAARQRQIRAGAAVLVLLILCVTKLLAFPDPQVRSEANPLELLKRWHHGVEGLPLGGMMAFWLSAGWAALATWGKSPLLARHRRWLWSASVCFALVGAAVWVVWASNAVHWRVAVDYRRYVLPLAMPFFIGALAAGVSAARRSGRSISGQMSPVRQNTPRSPALLPLVLAGTFLVVLGLQSVVWLNMLRRLSADVNNYPGVVVPQSAVAWTNETALYHWSLTSIHLSLSGPTPRKLLVWDSAWTERTTQPEPRIPTTEWAHYAPEPGPLGFYDFRPMLPRMQEELRRQRLSQAVPSSDGSPLPTP